MSDESLDGWSAPYTINMGMNLRDLRRARMAKGVEIRVLAPVFIEVLIKPDGNGSNAQ